MCAKAEEVHSVRERRGMTKGKSGVGRFAASRLEGEFKLDHEG